jgi:general secretion pathway protein D
VVVRDATATQALSTERYEQMRSSQQSSQPSPNSVMPVNEAPVMAPLPSKPAAGNTPGLQ